MKRKFQFWRQKSHVRTTWFARYSIDGAGGEIWKQVQQTAGMIEKNSPGQCKFRRGHRNAICLLAANILSHRLFFPFSCCCSGPIEPVLSSSILFIQKLVLITSIFPDNSLQATRLLSHPLHLNRPLLHPLQATWLLTHPLHLNCLLSIPL